MVAAPPPPPPADYTLRLYVTGTTTRSAKAIANLRRLCEARLAGRYELEVVDIYQEPGAAADHQILAAPTLVRLTPLPVRRIIGDLSDHGRLLSGLGLDALPETGDDC